MKLPVINPWTALVVSVGIAGTVALAYLKVDIKIVEAYAATFMLVAGTMQKLFGEKS